MIRAIVFDFDGVILESVDIKTEAFRELFSSYPEHVDRIVDLHLRNTGVSRYEKFAVIYEEYLGRELDAAELTRLDRRFSEIVLRRILKCPFVPGAREFLEEAHKSYKLFVASATPESELQEIVRRRGLAPFFTAVHGSPRTKAEIVRLVLREHALQPREVLFVGDARSDFVAAKETSVHFVGRVPAGAPNPFPDADVETVPSLVSIGERRPLKVQGSRVW